MKNFKIVKNILIIIILTIIINITMVYAASNTKTSSSKTNTSKSNSSVNTISNNVAKENTNVSSTEETEQTKVNDIVESISEDGLTKDNMSNVVKRATENIKANDKTNLLLSNLWNSNLWNVIFIVLIVIAIYRILLRAVIYKKAKKHAWATFIPIYRNIVMLNLCGMSPWWLLLLFVPVIGWLLLWLVSVASKFMLAESFNKGAGFGFGLWILGPIFESVIVFSKKTKYVGPYNKSKEQ